MISTLIFNNLINILRIMLKIFFLFSHSFLMIHKIERKETMKKK